MDKIYVIKMMDGRYACERDGIIRMGHLRNLIYSCNVHPRDVNVYYIAMNENDVDNFIVKVANKVHNNMVDFIVTVDYLTEF